MRRIIFFLIVSILGTSTVAQSFKETYHLIQNKNYFKAQTQFNESKNHYSFMEQKIIEALLCNAFNNPSKSYKIISQLSRKKNNISDTLMLKLNRIQTDNFIKTFKYKEAKSSIQNIFETYGKLLSEKESNDLKNSLNIWTTFQNEPPQKVKLNKPNPITMKIDEAGLKNLEIRTKKDSANFIFDTGANISTVTKTTAEKLNMKIFSVVIEVGSITGKKTRAQLAICPILYLGKIEIQNVIFLVFNDEALYIKEIDFQINGILGFPVIEALGEVKISKDNYFTVSSSKSKQDTEPNMAFDGLTPLLYIDRKHYTFDTGADETILYQTFFKENKDEIEQAYKKENIGFSGVGGKKEFEGYKISYDFYINGKNIKLNEIQLLTEKLNPNESVYGNIGQDFIRQFNSMTINFDQMFIKFE